MQYFVSNDELYHHGILGMKWGVRRYQNADGSLTAKGKARVSKEYKKVAIKVDEALRKNYNKMYVDSYNKAADKMNNGEIDKFNKAQEKKYGKGFANREGYADDYKDIFNKEFDNFMNQTLLDFYESNKSYKKGQDLVKQYGMEKWDDLVKTNEAGVRELRSQLKKARKNAKGREEIGKIITGKKGDVRNQKLQKRAAELASKYGDKATVEVKDNKILVTSSDGDKWRVY